MSKKPTVLMILDGYGLNVKNEANAVYEAKTPVMDKLMAECPFVKGNASGMAVGLPEGQMGNSEVGAHSGEIASLGIAETLVCVGLDRHLSVAHLDAERVCDQPACNCTE